MMKWIKEDKIRIFNLKKIFFQNAQGISKIYHEVILLMKFLQTKPQTKKMNINYYDLDYTVIRNRNEKEIVKKMKIIKMIVKILRILLYLIIMLEEKIIMKY